MAKTQKSYRLKARLPRYTTVFNAFSNGMYLTDQNMPEGYVRAMVNYDIDDTGSNIKPKKGREKVQVIDYESKKLGAASLTDYVYAYNSDETEIEDTKDLVLSYGLFTKMMDLAPTQNNIYNKPIYVSALNITEDTHLYARNEYDQWYPISDGTITNYDLKEFWALYYDTTDEKFKVIKNKDIGYVSARTIENAYAFEKPFKDVVGRPIGTVLNNEVIAFTGSIPDYNYYPATTERNELLNFNTPVLTKLKLVHNTDDITIRRNPIEPKQLNPAEAYTSGFNILSINPYELTNEIGGSLSILGIILYNNEGMPLFTPKIGEQVSLGIYYQYPHNGATIKYKVEVLDTTNNKSDWETLEEYTNSFTASQTKFTYNYNVKYQQQILRFTFRLDDDTTTEYPFTVLVDCTLNSKYSSLEGKTFDLSTCKGMISWQGCIGVYGVESAKDTIFFSDIGDPSYFPYPYNLISFDNEILAVHNYLNYLLVVTVDSIWLVTPNTTINTSIQKRILANLFIPEIDAINLVVLKDQIFFKTDTQFYVLKPNQYTSDSTDLKNYINSIAISNYTLNFKEETVDLLNKVYVQLWQDLTIKYKKQIRFEDFDVLDTHSVIRNEEVHYIYTIVPKFTDNIEDINDNLNLHLVYNTLTRSWRLYFVAIGNDSVYYNPLLYRNKQSGLFYEFFPYSKENSSAIVISKQTYDVVTDNLTNEDWNLTEHYNGFTYIDTGNVDLNAAFTKRFREVQFNLINAEKTTVKFYTDFILDGQERIHATKYEIQHITDINDPEYGLIYVVPIESTNLDLVGMTTLSNIITEDDYWSIDLSKFPDLNVNTIRFELQGRGRRGAIQLLNTTLQRYELSELYWVYRQMNAR